MQMPDEVSNGQVLEGSGWLIKFGGSRCRWPMKFRMVPVQIADKVAELSGAHSRQSSGGLRYKNLPRSSRLLGITDEFIFPTCEDVYCLGQDGGVTCLNLFEGLCIRQRKSAATAWKLPGLQLHILSMAFRVAGRSHSFQQKNVGSMPADFEAVVASRNNEALSSPHREGAQRS